VQAIVTVELFGIDDAERMRVAREIRIRVFVEEQGVPLDEEMDAHDVTDRAAVHALVYDDSGTPVGAGRFYAADRQTAQVGRMAVSAETRGAGAGAALLAGLLAEARRRGFTRAHLWAQTHACAFYRKAGFYNDGAPLWDAGIEHQPMSLTLV
jgi:predicted GNAT family N-acyltransferase